jgi:GNAT superfamily N-acetyltransferase
MLPNSRAERGVQPDEQPQECFRALPSPSQRLLADRPGCSLEKIMTSVRQIQPDEWQVLRAVRLAALQDAPTAFSETLAEARAMPDESWRDRAQRDAKGETSFCALAFDDGQPIGMAVGISDPDDSALAYLAAMWVAPEYRGTDAAPLLVDSVTRWAASLGAKILFAGVLEGNTRAAAFFQKVGFVPHTGTVPDHPTINGSGLVLSKKLQ